MFQRFVAKQAAPNRFFSQTDELELLDTDYFNPATCLIIERAQNIFQLLGLRFT
jgi:hypothetical protein